MSKKSVFFDANVLYSWHLNHLLMFFCDTGTGLIEPYWSDLVVEEAQSNIFKNTQDDASTRFELMNKAYPNACVTGFEVEKNIEGVHSDDQHVAKAAIHNECDFLLTNNFKHFQASPDLQVRPKVVTPDTLLTALAKRSSEDSFKSTALAWWHLIDEISFDDYLFILSDSECGLGLVHFVPRLINLAEAKKQLPLQYAQRILESEIRRY